MAEETKTVKASCLCGTFYHDITLPSAAFPLYGHMCHCTTCRHVSGALATTPAFLPSSFEPSQPMLEKLSTFKPTQRGTVYFCPTCGAQAMGRYRISGEDEESKFLWIIATGSLEQLDGIVEFGAHMQIRDTIDGGLATFLPSVDGKTLARWPANYHEGEQLPFDWTGAEQGAVPEPSSKDMLHGSCKCKGTQFYIARPSTRSALTEKYWPSTPPNDCSESELPPKSETHWLQDNRTKFLCSLCVCNSCRLALGMEVTSWAFVPPCDIFLDAEGKTPVPHSMEFGTVKHYTSSLGIHRYFCGDCGATLFYNADDRRHYTDIAMGLFDAPGGARAESWFSWRPTGVDYAEDAEGRAESLARSIQAGFEAFQKQQDRK
ncbi:unnamed protein product [Zymoseptoria tritici ST99CH_1E4]|uniref:CENP-V/GFA domain-containing protein n=1 Tax=Zymoseptoria tritici ST99CH_1E4 TaxID=1276532 RepID=A0A2H1G3Z8_ZYMTR|nr:unnamed protein product [Zymoseptoria tritici ST99CH_1E4]